MTRGPGTAPSGAKVDRSPTGLRYITRMGTRSQGWCVSPTRPAHFFAAALLVVGFGAVAHADPKADAAKAAKAAMADYDTMDYDAAQKSLERAIKTADAKLPKDPLTAKLHLYLGITSYANGDTDGTKREFKTAAKIDAKIQIEAAYKSPELVKLLEDARGDAGGSMGSSEPGDGVDCASVEGIKFSEPDGGHTGVAQKIEAYLANDVRPAKVAVMYRPKGQVEFTESKLTKSGDCKYVGKIPGSAVKGSTLQYYVAAFDGRGKAIKSASAGSSRVPNILDISAAPAGAEIDDGEDPINGRKKPKTVASASDGATENISGGVLAGGKAPKVFIALVGGTGFGYVTGDTEAGNQVQNCCIGNSLVVLTPELGYYVNRQLSIGIAGRIGLPIGANVDPPNATHSTIAPGAVLRVRYALSNDGQGLRLMGQVGGGVMRNTIKLEMQPGGGDTDIVAQGPLLIGAGVGFMKKLSNNLAFVADLSALAGIAVIDKLGTTKLNTGIGGDVSVGVSVGF